MKDDKEKQGTMIDIPKDDSYPEGLGSVGDTGTLSYEVVAEDESKCTIRITSVDTEDMDEMPDNSGDAFARVMTKKGVY